MDAYQIQEAAKTWRYLNGYSGDGAGIKGYKVSYQQHKGNLIVKYTTIRMEMDPVTGTELPVVHGYMFTVELDERLDLYNVVIAEYKQCETLREIRLDGLYWEDLVAGKLLKSLLGEPINKDIKCECKK